MLYSPAPSAGTKLHVDGTITCSSGPIECDGHKWMSCRLTLLYPVALVTCCVFVGAIDLFKDDVQAQIKALAVRK